MSASRITGLSHFGLSSRPQHAHNVNDALRLARDDLADFLPGGGALGVPVGLCVSVV